MSETVLRLTVELQKRGPAAAIVLTDDQVSVLSDKKVFPVRYTIGGTTVEGRLARMGGENLIGLNKAVRTQLGVEAGDVVAVVIEPDDVPREVVLPDALAAALDPAARRAFDALAPSKRKEHARSVAEAKKDDTRDRRIAAIVESLRDS
jgi:bifunctional DNA-binding transcriptional regulator/antitoxin component of YhaV-PrlF toxin-antitoxin module